MILPLPTRWQYLAFMKAWQSCLLVFTYQINCAKARWLNEVLAPCPDHRANRSHSPSHYFCQESRASSLWQRTRWQKKAENPSSFGRLDEVMAANLARCGGRYFSSLKRNAIVGLVKAVDAKACNACSLYVSNSLLLCLCVIDPSAPTYTPLLRSVPRRGYNAINVVHLQGTTAGRAVKVTQFTSGFSTWKLCFLYVSLLLQQ